MKVTRAGCQLKVDVTTGIGYYLTFTHSCHSEADAEAWLQHIHNREARDQSTISDRENRQRVEQCDRENQIFRLKRRVQYLRRVNRKLRTRNAP